MGQSKLGKIIAAIPQGGGIIGGPRGRANRLCFAKWLVIDVLDDCSVLVHEIAVSAEFPEFEYLVA